MHDNEGTKTELAARLKVSVKRVTTAIERGAISAACVGVNSHGQRYIADMTRAEADFRAADKRLPRSDTEVPPVTKMPVLPDGIDPATLGEGVMPPAGIDLNTARTIREWWAALSERHDYERKAGQFVERDYVERGAFAAFRATRDSILALPDRLADDLAAEADPRAVHQRVRTEVQRILDDLTATLGKLTGAAIA